MTDAELAEKRHLADANLRRAIELHAEAYHLDDDDTMLDQFALIAVWQPVIDDGTTIYTLHSHAQNDCPAHIKLGLHHQAIHLITHNG